MIPAPQVQIPFRIPALKSHCYTATPLKFTMEPNNQPLKNMNLWITLRKFYIVPENRPSQKETHLLTIDFQGRAVKLRGCIEYIELLSSFQKSDAGAARFGHVPVIKTLLESKAQLHQRLKGAGAHGMGCNGGADQHR